MQRGVKFAAQRVLHAVAQPHGMPSDTALLRLLKQRSASIVVGEEAVVGVVEVTGMHHDFKARALAQRVDAGDDIRGTRPPRAASRLAR